MYSTKPQNLNSRRQKFHTIRTNPQIFMSVGEQIFRSRQAVYVKRNNETRSCNHCCGGKPISIACSEYAYRGADNSLARPGKKQATATEDFDIHISYL